MSETILAAAHGPDAADAVALAAELARLHECSVVVCAIYVLPAGPYARPFEQAARTALRRDLDRLAAGIPADVPHATLLHACTSVVRGLQELAESQRARAVVLAATRRGAVGRAVHGDVAAGLLHGAPCTIAVAPHGWAMTHRRLGQDVVGVGWDGGAEARLALAEAERLAERHHASLELLSVVEPLPHSAKLDFPDDPAMARSRLDAARASVSEAAAEVRDRSGLDVETVVLDGVSAGHALTDASAALDALVLGSRSYGPVRRVLLGSVSAHVAHAAACPVLVLPRGAGAPEEREAAARLAGHGAR